jgi:transcription-repair coupling factor (superfamily II helicase)
VTGATAPEGGAALDPGALADAPPFATLCELLEREKRVDVGSLWGSSQALVLAALTQRAQGPWLVTVSTEAEAELFADDLATCGVDARHFPARESFASARAGEGGHMHADPATVRMRLQVAQQLAGPPERRPRTIVASVLSLLQPIPTPRDLERDFLHLQVNQRLDALDLVERLVAGGYARQPLAEQPGEVSLRGDILDVYSFASELPLRIELFDEEIESLRTFDPETQRSVEAAPQVTLCIASDVGGVEDGEGVQAVQMLSPTTMVVEVEPLRIEDQAEGLRIQSSAHARGLMELDRWWDGWRHLSLQSLPARKAPSANGHGAAALDFDTRSVQRLAVGMRAAPDLLRQEAADGKRVVVLCTNQAERDRFTDILGDERVEVGVGTLARGFELREPGLVVLAHRELLGIVGTKRRAVRGQKHHVRALESFFELKAGDLVVHAVHGVARFVGLEHMSRAGGEEEHLHLMFADEVSVYVPAPRIDLVQRYIGSGSAAPDLDRIGSQSFRRRKERVERALVDLAADLLEVQAKRELRRRQPWAFDRELEDELIRSFPYADTKDQASVDLEVAADLSSPRPMDRLLCGDVGFGKTELAVRAAFRVVTGGGQVALLVPTTVLATQHHATFCERLADFPVEVEVLSRHVTGAKARAVLERVEAGEVDVLIGTHRILSKDVRFAKLGLVIVDEEQRFGVTHKEHFKRMRSELDLLTLTATPIPRTLHMSLAGLRDISALTEPPEGRQEIETRLASTQDTDRIRRALLREKNRGGQAFFLHNRVHSIEARARELQALVPECTYAIGHGQMSGRELRDVMDTFLRGDADVLVATTIVENGLDIPSAGTILMDEADHFGLSELHQLRGRVGRGDHKAYCYLLIDHTRPLRQEARERLKAIEELTQLGAGFQISMKDLEIRGAGNILGPEQSGHIAAIGYDMYCRLLHRTVERMRSSPEDLSAREELWTSVPEGVTEELEAAAVELELGMRAFLPDEWIADPSERLELLRRLNTIDGPRDAQEVLAMLRDRYGRIPEEARHLVRQFELRAVLAGAGIRRLAWRQDTFLLEYGDRLLLEGALAGAEEVELRPLGAGRAHLVVPPAHRTPEAAADWIHGLLRPAGSAPKMAARGSSP